MEDIEITDTAEELENLKQELQSIKDSYNKQTILFTEAVSELAKTKSELNSRNQEIIALISKIAHMEALFTETYKMALTSTFTCAKIRDMAKTMIRDKLNG